MGVGVWSQFDVLLTFCFIQKLLTLPLKGCFGFSKRDSVKSHECSYLKQTVVTVQLIIVHMGPQRLKMQHFACQASSWQQNFAMAHHMNPPHACV